MVGDSKQRNMHFETAQNPIMEFATEIHSDD